MAIALPNLARSWPMIELPGYRDHKLEYSTYSHFEFSNLPPIAQQLDAGLEWLRTRQPVDDSLGDSRAGDPTPARKATSEELDAMLVARPQALPTSFETFIREQDYRSRIRSATACYLDLADFAIASRDGGLLVHFMSDQQWVLHWLLYVGQGNSEAVVVTDVPFGFEADGESPRRFPRDFDPASGDVAVCAESFSEFLYRFWIENEIWFRLTAANGDVSALTPKQARYAEHYRGH
jgi:hypothetical protein